MGKNYRFVKKTGFEVIFSSPVKKSYEIDWEDRDMAIGAAIDYAKHRHPCHDWSKENIKYTVRERTYQDWCRD